MFDKLIEKVKAEPKTIVFTEGSDARIQEAAARLLAEGLMNVILVGDVDEVKKAAEEKGFDISKAEIIDPEKYEGMDEMVAKMVELRKGKMTEEECAAALKKGNYFGTMLVKMGKADCLLGGATYSTADTIRPALQLVKTKPGAHLVSSCFILTREGGDENLRTIAMGDCAVNLGYEDSKDKEGNVTFTGAQKLAEVAVEIEKCARTFGIDPKVAMLSFSTKGSGKGNTVALSAEATKIAKELNPDMAIDGEMQFDAAVSPTVGLMPTHSYSLSSRQATSATRSLRDSAAMLLTDLSCSDSTLRSTTSPEAATQRKSTRWQSSQLHCSLLLLLKPINEAGMIICRPFFTFPSNRWILFQEPDPGYVYSFSRSIGT